jgi:leucine dehydrogenase
MRAAAEEAFGSQDLAGKHVVIQGVGAVGGRLAVLLKERGAQVSISDINAERVDELCSGHGFTAVDDEDHLDVECDIYAPCARGAGINLGTIPRLRCKIIAGCANNQLLEFEHAEVLREMGILYAPDYVINAGGIINVSIELLDGGYDEEAAMAKIENIYVSLKRVFEISREDGVPTNVAALRLAEERLAQGQAD